MKLMGKILMHDNGAIFKEGDHITPGIITNLKIPYKEFIQKEVIEEIARDVINNSKFLMKDKKPFVKPKSESNGECDNIGNNYEIDTKLLWMQSVCYKIARSQKKIKFEVSDYSQLYNFFPAYKRYKKRLKAVNKTQENQYEMLDTIKRILNKNKEKNILFIFPIPQLDMFFMNDLNFSKSFFWAFFWALGRMKRDCNFKKDIYFAYPLLTNEYNLVKIDIKSFTCEPFIKSEVQSKYLESIEFGVYKDKKFYPFWLELEKEENYVYRFKYKKYDF